MKFSRRISFLPVCLFFMASALLLAPIVESESKDDDPTKCELCRILVTGFEKELKRTARLNFAGGDVSWEEEKKLSYATSETRLLEVMETACGSDHKAKCQYMLEEQEEALEDWWFKKRKTNKDLLSWLCIVKMKVCCGKNKFGKQCKACPGGVESPCSGVGTCEGAGDRKGSGVCVCNSGYAGRKCEQCDSAYVNVGNSSAVKCEPCHRSCALNCTGKTASDCDDCKTGWEERDDICQDVNECSRENPPCQVTGKYCRNTEGSYVCALCSKACADNCTSGNASSCRECAVGYSRSNESAPCLDLDECAANSSLCETGTYCKNTEGSFSCWGCNAACADGCTSAGADHCTQCAAGYELINVTCTDIDECLTEPCNATSENCHNNKGSFTCDCKDGFTRNEGRCEQKASPTKDDEEEENDDEEDDEEDENDGKDDSEDAEETADDDAARPVNEGVNEKDEL